MRERGTPLIEGLERHLPGSLEHAEASGSYAFAAAVELGHSRSELIREAARLHEIGQVYVSTEVLGKRGDVGVVVERRRQADALRDPIADRPRLDPSVVDALSAVLERTASTVG